MNVFELARATQIGFRRARLGRMTRLIIDADRRVDLINTSQEYV